ncbi:MAG: LysR family transcriptional regulator, partial [Lachnospiraceae bacterium]|nr:LysR family transcriptional regulator [Lachnospiraceae bacterium]
MTLSQIRYFLAVARELNFSRAAEALYVSQPAVSKQVSQLEQELGVKLFDRTNQGLVL